MVEASAQVFFLKNNMIACFLSFPLSCACIRTQMHKWTNAEMHKYTFMSGFENDFWCSSLAVILSATCTHVNTLF
jgi:hypothetical protein